MEANNEALSAAHIEAARRQASEAIGIDYEVLTAVLARKPGDAVPGQRPDLGDLSAQEAQIVNRLLPLQVRSARGVSPSTMINAVLFKARSNFSGWRGLPSMYGNADLLRQRHGRWLASGIWIALLDRVRNSSLSEARKMEFARLGETVAADTHRMRERRIEPVLCWADGTSPTNL